MSKLQKQRARKQQVIIEQLPPKNRGIKLSHSPSACTDASTPLSDQRSRSIDNYIPNKQQTMTNWHSDKNSSIEFVVTTDIGVFQMKTTGKFTSQQVTIIVNAMKELHAKAAEAALEDLDWGVYLSESGGALPEIRKIGETLNRLDGWGLMSKICSTVPRIYQRELELAWNGIGTWLA